MSESNVADSFLLAAHSLIITHTNTNTDTKNTNTFRHIRFGQFVNNQAEKDNQAQPEGNNNKKTETEKSSKLTQNFKSKERRKNTKQQIQLPFFWTEQF